MSIQQDLIRQRIEDGRRRTQELYQAEQRRLREAAELAEAQEAKRKILEQEEWEVIKPVIAQAVAEASNPGLALFREGADADSQDTIEVRLPIPGRCTNISPVFIQQQFLSLRIVATVSCWRMIDFKFKHNHQFPNTDWGAELQSIVVSSRKAHIQKRVDNIRESIIIKLSTVPKGTTCDLQLFQTLNSREYSRDLTKINHLYLHILELLKEFFPVSEYDMSLFALVERAPFPGHYINRGCLRITERLTPKLRESAALPLTDTIEGSVAGTMVLSPGSVSTRSSVLTPSYARASRAAPPSLFADVKDKCKDLFKLRR